MRSAKYKVQPDRTIAAPAEVSKANEKSRPPIPEMRDIIMDAEKRQQRREEETGISGITDEQYKEWLEQQNTESDTDEITEE